MSVGDTKLKSNCAGAESIRVPSPRRVAAGKLNRARRKGLSEWGRERLRRSALAHKPWMHSTGPRTPEGKAKVARNGKLRQHGPFSIREIRTELAGLSRLTREMEDSRDFVRELLSLGI